MKPELYRGRRMHDFQTFRRASMLQLSTSGCLIIRRGPLWTFLLTELASDNNFFRHKVRVTVVPLIRCRFLRRFRYNSVLGIRVRSWCRNCSIQTLMIHDTMFSNVGECISPPAVKLCSPSSSYLFHKQRSASITGLFTVTSSGCSIFVIPSGMMARSVLLVSWVLTDCIRWQWNASSTSASPKISVASVAACHRPRKRESQSAIVYTQFT